MQQNPGATVTKYEIAKSSSKPYLKAMSPDNIVSSFRTTEVYPLKPELLIQCLNRQHLGFVLNKNNQKRIC